MKFPVSENTVKSGTGKMLNEVSHFKKIPVPDYIFSVIAFIGIITVFMPWADVTVGFYAKTVASGMQFYKGWLVFLVFLNFIIIKLFNRYLKIKVEYAQKIIFWGPLIIFSLCLIFIIWHLFKVNYGVYLSAIISVLLFIFNRFITRKSQL